MQQQVKEKKEEEPNINILIGRYKCTGILSSFVTIILTIIFSYRYPANDYWHKTSLVGRYYDY